jgi:hypothetical protein
VQQGIINNWFSALEAKPRLALLIAVGLIFASVYMFFQVVDWGNDLEVEVDQVQKKYAELDSLSKEEFWNERLEKSQAILSNLESRLWPMQKEGVARINLTNEVKEFAAKSGLKPLSITAENPAIVKGVSGFKRFTVRLRARFTPDALEAFAELLAKDERQFIFQELNITLIPFKSFDAKISVMMPQPESGKRTKGRRKRSTRQ